MEEIVFHKKNFDFLKKALFSGKLHHAYVFYGLSGSGKLSFAKFFARFLRCSQNKEGETCGECDNCRGSFLDDVHILDGRDRNILIEEVREWKKFLDFSPITTNGKKILIINKAENLTDEAKELLLKTLEEPPSRSIIILLTDKKGTLPETILSRCQSLFFQRPSKDILKKICPDIAKSEFFDIAYLGNCGSLIFLDELRNLNDKELKNKYDDLIGDLEIVMGDKKFSKMVFAKELLGKGDLKERIESWISILYFIFLNKGGNIQDGDYNYDLLKILEKRLNYGKIESALVGLLKLMEVLSSSNANERISLENFFLEAF